MKYLLKFYNDKGEMKKYTSSGSSRRISLLISRLKFSNAYLKVSYGKRTCNFGCLCEFYNDGWYEFSDTLKKALLAFREET